MTASEKLDCIMREFQIKKKSELAAMLRISPQNLNYWIKSNFIDSKLVKHAFPSINSDWLLFGSGDMLIDSQNNNSGNIVNDAGHDNFFTPQQEQGVSNLLEEKDKRIEGLEREVASLKADKEKLWELVMNRTNPDNR